MGFPKRALLFSTSLHERLFSWRICWTKSPKDFGFLVAIQMVFRTHSNARMRQKRNCLIDNQLSVGARLPCVLVQMGWKSLPMSIDRFIHLVLRSVAN